MITRLFMHFSEIIYACGTHLGQYGGLCPLGAFSCYFPSLSHTPKEELLLRLLVSSTCPREEKGQEFLFKFLCDH